MLDITTVTHVRTETLCCTARATPHTKVCADTCHVNVFISTKPWECAAQRLKERREVVKLHSACRIVSYTETSGESSLEIVWKRAGIYRVRQLVNQTLSEVGREKSENTLSIKKRLQCILCSSLLLTSSITDLTVVSMLTPWPGIIDVLKPIITAFHNWAWNRSVDSHNHILPSFHYSFNVCICRICHRYKENTPAQQVRGGFFPSLTLSPSYKGDNENSPSYKWDHEKSHHCIYRWSSKANAKWTDTRKWASAVQQRSRHAAHRHPVCPASKKCSLSC